MPQGSTSGLVQRGTTVKSLNWEQSTAQTAVLSVRGGLLGSMDERLVSLAALLDLVLLLTLWTIQYCWNGFRQPMGLGVQTWTGLFSTWVAVFSQSLLIVLCQPPALLCVPRGTVLEPDFFTLCRGVGEGSCGKQVGSMDEEPRVRGCYNITFICTPTNQETVSVLEKTQANKTFRIWKQM